MKRVLPTAIIVIFTGALFGGGVYWWQKNEIKNSFEQQIQSSQNQMAELEKENKKLHQTLLAEATLRIQNQSSIDADNYSSDLVQEWIDLMLIVTKETPGFTPPVAARAFGYTGLSLYESVRFGIPNSQSLAGQINGFEKNLLADAYKSASYDWRLVANANLATIIRLLYPNASDDNKSKIDLLEKKLLADYTKGLKDNVINDSMAFGKAVAERIASYAESDGQSKAYTTNFPADFVPPSGEGLWVPTPDAYQKAMQPYWGNVRPFMLENIDGSLLPPPPQYSTEQGSQFYTETQEVYNTVKSLTEDQLAIAKFWSDDPGKTATPPGHSVSILRQILKQENASLATAAMALAKVGMGVHDSFVACWRARYIYNLVRPITLIRAQIDSEFEIPLNTPPFPEYPSGHSVQSGATAQILTDLFGENYHFTDTTHQARTDIDGSPRSFNSFNDFASEAAISRLYGGIHFRSAIELGVAQGVKIGKNISSLQFDQ